MGVMGAIAAMTESKLRASVDAHTAAGFANALHVYRERTRCLRT
jgi:hypothetical protein